MTVLLALVSGLMWGAADYFGGTASKRLPALVVVMISQTAGLVFALGTAMVTGALAAPTGYVPWAVGAGLAGAAALVLFYRALAIGTMGVVSPIAALGVVVPVLIGLITGVLPSILCLAGIVVAVSGVVAAAGPQRAGGGRRAGHGRSVVMAIGAAAGFGLVLYAISGGARYSTAMTMVVMRSTSVPLLVGLVLVGVRSRRTSGGSVLIGERRFQALGHRLVAAIVICGVFDVGANLLFGVASHSGSLAVVAVLGSLYPAATVLLARFVDGERLSRLQNIGVAAALAGVAMIAAGT